MKICPVGAELFHADRHDNSNSRFLQFCWIRLKMFENLVLNTKNLVASQRWIGTSRMPCGNSHLTSPCKFSFVLLPYV